MVHMGAKCPKNAIAIAVGAHPGPHGITQLSRLKDIAVQRHLPVQHLWR